MTLTQSLLLYLTCDRCFPNFFNAVRKEAAVAFQIKKQSPSFSRITAVDWGPDAAGGRLVKQLRDTEAPYLIMMAAREDIQTFLDPVHFILAY